MARKNLDKDQEVFQELSTAILRYGEEGALDLEDLFEKHRPDIIFKLDSGPERSVRAAQLLTEMREVRRELAASRQTESSGSAGGVRVSKIGLEIPGVYDGFRYVILQLPSGQWTAKITRRGRQILEDPDLPDAPLIVGSPELNKVFPSQSAAEAAVHRVIRKALIWYGERGLVPREKRRKTQMGRAGIQRRTAGQVAERERQAKEAEFEKLEKRRREKIRGTRREEKMKRLDRPPRSEVAPVGRGRKLVYIPKKNPSNPFTFSHSGSDALNQGKASVQKFEEWKERWNDSLESKNPDFKAIFKAYDHIANAQANFILAEAPALADKAERIRSDLRSGMVDILVACNRFKKGKRFDHEGAAKANMQRADVAWTKYAEDQKFSDLLAAYKHLEIAKEEFRHDGDDEGVQQARARIRLVKKEIRELLGN